MDYSNGVKLGCLELAEMRDNAGKRAVETAFQVAFPNGDHPPSGLAEVTRLFLVAGYIAVKFFLPKCSIVLWQRILAFRAAMPETAVDKDRQPA